MRRAISPRLAIRILLEHQACPPRAAASAAAGVVGDRPRCRTSSWPYSTASPASTRLDPTTPSTGATTSWRTPSTSTMADADRRPGPASRRRSAPRLEDADGRRGAPRIARSAGVGRRPAGPTAATGRAVAAGGRGGLRRAGRAPRPAWPRLRPRPVGARRPRRPPAGPAQADLPVALADLELAQAARAELGDQRRQELVGEAVDRGVVGAARGGARRGRARRSDLARGRRRLVLGGRGSSRSPRPERPGRPPARLEEVAQAVRRSPGRSGGAARRRLARSVNAPMRR